MRIKDIAGERTVDIDADNHLSPGSVFIACGGFCVELDRGTFIQAIKEGFGLTDPVADELEQMLAMS